MIDAAYDSKNFTSFRSVNLRTGQSMTSYVIPGVASIWKTGPDNKTVVERIDYRTYGEALRELWSMRQLIINLLWSEIS